MVRSKKSEINWDCLKCKKQIIKIAKKISQKRKKKQKRY